LLNALMATIPLLLAFLRFPSPFFPLFDSRAFTEIVRPGGRAILFLDEIQNVPSWERRARLRTALELLEGAGDMQELGLAYMGLQWSHLWKGNFTEVFRLKETALSPKTRELSLSPHVRKSVMPLGIGQKDL